MTNYEKVLARVAKKSAKAFTLLKNMEHSKVGEQVNFTTNIINEKLSAIMDWHSTPEGYDFWNEIAEKIGERKKPIFDNPTRKSA